MIGAQPLGYDHHLRLGPFALGVKITAHTSRFGFTARVFADWQGQRSRAHHLQITFAEPAAGLTAPYGGALRRLSYSIPGSISLEVWWNNRQRVALARQFGGS